MSRLRQIRISAGQSTAATAHNPTAATAGKSGLRGSGLHGGETPAGKEIHYWVSRQDFGLQKTTFGR